MPKRIPSDPYRHLRLANKHESLALFVGAGLSYGCGLPKWDELLDRMTVAAFPKDHATARNALEGLPQIVKTRFIKNILGTRFNEVIADALYQTPYTISGPLKKIAKSGIRRICTYNFDDTIEEALQSEGIRFDVVGPGEPFNTSSWGTVLFHPHGIIPSDADRAQLQGQQIVFSEDDFNSLYSNAHSQANLIQISLLLNFTCLFVGISFNDPNLRRILDVCRSAGLRTRHYAIMMSPMYAAADWSKPIKRKVKEYIEMDLEQFRIEPIFVRNNKDIEGIFESIRNRNGIVRAATQFV